MLTEYIDAAMRHAKCEELTDDRSIYCDIGALPGVWANEATTEEALRELRSVLEAWIALGIAMHEPIPAIDGVEISILGVR